MGRLIAIALGAGLASALLSMVLTTGSLLAVPLAYLMPLPIMIAAIGFGHLTGILSVVMAGLTVALVVGPLPGLFFVLTLGLPAWWLGYLVLLGRPVDPPAHPSPDQKPTASGQVNWYPVHNIMMWMAILAAGPVLAAGLLIVWHFGGYQHAIKALTWDMRQALEGASVPEEGFAANFIRIAPMMVAASNVLMMGFNLWLAGRIVLMSERLIRSWPDLPESIHFPKPAAWIFVALLVASTLPDPIGLGFAVMAAALGMAFACAGLAIAHSLSRGLPARPLILAAIYLTVFILMSVSVQGLARPLPWPLLGLALIGCLDCFVPLRGRTKPLAQSKP